MGMFATTKRWWRTIGGVDAELSMLGGENIEISLRTWLCGGDIRVARGSRIDHLFRPSFPYTVDGKQYRRNLVRIAEAWFDSDAKHNFYRASGFLPGSVDFGSIQEQRQLQKKLNCRPFSWYMNRFRKRAPVDRAP
jgi:polypeptide N-acetylgalactosaminyltransferase